MRERDILLLLTGVTLLPFLAGCGGNNPDSATPPPLKTSTSSARNIRISSGSSAEPTPRFRGDLAFYAEYILFQGEKFYAKKRICASDQLTNLLTDNELAVYNRSRGDLEGRKFWVDNGVGVAKRGWGFGCVNGWKLNPYQP